MSVSMRNLFRGRLRKAALVGTAAACVAVPLSAVPAQADLVPYVAWSTYLPGWTDEYIPTSENDCVAGKPNCLNATLRELSKIFDDSAGNCTHDAIFSLAYLRITQTYGWSRDIDGYYQDVPFANHQDAVFARYFTDAYWNYKNGNLSAVPQAWILAFDASRDRKMTGIGDLLLGMNAHINRDLAFVVAGVGTVAPDGSSRKIDYDKVEDFLNLASEPMLAEAAQRFDPTVDDSNDPLGLSYASVFQLISLWRENAWRNAEALISAATPEERAAVAARIESEAEQIAQGIIATNSYVPPLTTTTSRDLYCNLHKGDAAPMAYPFGTPQPWGY